MTTGQHGRPTRGQLAGLWDHMEQQANDWTRVVAAAAAVGDDAKATTAQARSETWRHAADSVAKWNAALVDECAEVELVTGEDVQAAYAAGRSALENAIADDIFEDPDLRMVELRAALEAYGARLLARLKIG